jgi:hypothetical protein
MDTLKTLSKTLILSLLLTFFHSCAFDSYLRTERAMPEELTGTYALFLHGARHIDDVENAAILDKEGDPYTFEIYAPEYDYTVKKGVPAKAALEEAEAFVRYHRDFKRSRLSKIVDKAGHTIGYELRPIYHAFHLGQADVLYIDYMMKDNKVITTIREKDLDNKPLMFRGMSD